jgi:hypothetical protein
MKPSVDDVTILLQRGVLPPIRAQDLAHTPMQGHITALHL